MVREVTHEATGPIRFDAADLDDRGGSIRICLCGLSGRYPLCDDSHEVTQDEGPARRYRYESGGEERREIVTVEFVDAPGDRTDAGDDETNRGGEDA